MTNRIKMIDKKFSVRGKIQKQLLPAFNEKMGIFIKGLRILPVLMAMFLLAGEKNAVTGSKPVYGVCPFTNTSNDKKLDWISDGICESLSNDLKLANFAVVDRFHIKDVIREIELGQTGLINEKNAIKSGMLTGATHLITGSFQVVSGNIRIVSKVIAVETGVVSRSAKVTGALNSLFDLQDGLFTGMFEKPGDDSGIVITSAVKKEIMKKPTTSLGAYQYYLLCEEYNYKGANLDDAKSAGYLRQSAVYGLEAVKLDPRMTKAYLKLAHTYGGLQDDAGVRKYIALAHTTIGPETDIILKHLVTALYEIRINKNFRRSIIQYDEALKFNESNIEALWQLWGIYRGAFGSDVYDKSRSDFYGRSLVNFYPKSILAKHVRDLSRYDRLR